MGESPVRKELPEALRQWYRDWFLIDRLYTRWAKRYGLTYASLFTLYVLYHHDNCTPSCIAEFLSLTKQTVNSTLRRLEEDGIIAASPSQTDRRSQIVSLTEKGRQYTREVLEALYNMEERAFSGFSDRELGRIVNSNRQLAASIRREVEEDLEHARQ